MKKILSITGKEVKQILRDRTALILMIVAPLALTLIMQFAFSGMDTSSGLPKFDVVIVNQDDGELGKALVDVLTSEGLADLITPNALVDPDKARVIVDDDKASAAVIIPKGLTDQVTELDIDPTPIIVYTNPGRPISAGVVVEIISKFSQQVSTGVLGAEVTITQLLQTGRISIEELSATAMQIGQRTAVESVGRDLVTVNEVIANQGSTEEDFNFLAYYAPSFAILFLMFTMTNSSRTIITEREEGTLQRLRTTPTHTWELLGGKVSGALVTGLLQMATLIIASNLLMGVQWGDATGVIIHVFLVVTATASMGLMIAALSKTSGQAAMIGGAVVMVLAVVGGNFVPRLAFPAWLIALGWIGPNSWGIEGFGILSKGGKLPDLLPEIGALVAMTCVFFSISMVGFRRVFR